MNAVDCILFSGGAPGAEAEFGACAERHGVEEVNFTFEGHKIVRHRGVRVLNHEELQNGDVSLEYVSRLMHRRFTDAPTIRKILQTIWYQVLPVALPGILTGMILALSRAIGETAPLVMIGALSFVAFTPRGPLDQFTVLPLQIFNWVSRPQEEFRQLAAGAIIVLLIVLLLMNAVAILVRNRYQKRS